MIIRRLGIIPRNQLKSGLHVLAVTVLAATAVHAQVRSSSIALRIDGCAWSTVAGSYRFETQGSFSTKMLDTEFPASHLPNLTITKPVDGCGATLFERFNTGTPVMDLLVTQSTNAQPVLSISLYNAFVVNYQLTIDPLTQSAAEVVTFAPQRIRIAYPQAGTHAGWDYAVQAPY